MPVKSKVQWRGLFAREARGEIPAGTAREMAHETRVPFSRLPEHVQRKPRSRNPGRPLSFLTRGREPELRPRPMTSVAPVESERARSRYTRPPERCPGGADRVPFQFMRKLLDAAAFHETEIDWDLASGGYCNADGTIYFVMRNDDRRLAIWQVRDGRISFKRYFHGPMEAAINSVLSLAQ
jgi:hypothetical protein